MDFGLDDGLESDDSFFEEPKALTKKPSLAKGEKQSVEDIFKFTEDGLAKESKSKGSEDIFGKKSTVKFDETSAKKSTDDWLGVGLETDKRTDFLGDILGGNPKTEKKVASFEDILKDSKAANPKPTLKTLQKEEGSNLLSEASSREKRRQRRPSGSGVEDVLGLFGNEYSSGDFTSKNKPETPVKKSDAAIKPTTPKEQVSESVPDWLAGASNVKSDTSLKPAKSSITVSSSESGIQKDIPNEKPVEKSLSVEAVHEIQSESSIKTNPIDFQSSYSALQQQESFLLVSMQLKKYEENLNDIKKHQQEILSKQEKQFHDLVGKYIEKQQMVESSIILQQERINNHIKLLISEPAKVTENSDETDRKEVDLLVKNLQQRHAEEFFLMEESYKKQISLLEKSSEALEERLTTELTNITKSFQEKLESAQNQHKEEIEYYKQKVQNLAEQHSQEIDLLKLNQSRAIEDLKNEHLSQLEYLKQTNNFESSLKQDANLYSAKLDNNLEVLATNSQILAGLQEKVLSDYSVFSVAKQSSIDTKEKEVTMMRNALEKCREAAEKERTQLMTLVRTLETKLAEQNENSREERWALQQAAATLTARSAALDREAEFNRNSIEREREQLKTLKESMLAEQEKLLMQITEEKLQLSAERSRFEVSAKLSTNFEAEKMKAEAGTAVEVARELTDKINREREQLARQKAEVDDLRRKLLERERELLGKEEELDYLTRNVREKINEDKRAIFDAKNAESRYKEKLRELQSQVASLSNRERKLAEEKLLLSKERLTLFTAMKQGHKRCILCKTEGEQNDRDFEVFSQNNVQEYDTVRLRVDLLEDEKNSEVSREESNINQINDIS